MLEIFFPRLFVDSIFHIEYKILFEKEITNLIFDIDNTLVPFDIPEPTIEILKLFKELKEMGFNICLLSNNNEQRVTSFNKSLNILAVPNGRKPSYYGINKALGLLNSNEKNTAIIGDQVFTDIWCGNRKKMFTILVTPVASRDEFFVKLKRGIEKIVINSYLKRSTKND